MPLKLRPGGLGSGIDKDHADYTVFTGEWEVGRIYQTRGGPESLRWFWSMTVNGPMTRSDRVAILEEAKAQRFRRVGTPGRRGRSWKRWIKKRGARGWAPDKEAYHTIVEARSMVPDRSRTASFHHLISGMLKR
jgi:hypothetical protein